MRISLDGKAMTQGSVLALGMFDGVHLGHQVLLLRAKALAGQQGAPLAVCTFATHPMELIQRSKSPPMLTTLNERVRLMEGLGVDLLCAQPFDRKTMGMPPEEYVGRLVQRFHPVTVVVGYNHTFGKDGVGTPHLLTHLGDALGFSTEVVPKITLDGDEVSSTAVRELLKLGQVDAARRMLGRPYRREAAVAMQTQGGYQFVMMPNGKQNVPGGVYRVVVENEGKRLPMVVSVRREGQAVAVFPQGLSLREEVTFHFYHREGQGEAASRW